MSLNKRPFGKSVHNFVCLIIPPLFGSCLLSIRRNCTGGCRLPEGYLQLGLELRCIICKNMSRDHGTESEGLVQVVILGRGKPRAAEVRPGLPRRAFWFGRVLLVGPFITFMFGLAASRMSQLTSGGRSRHWHRNLSIRENNYCLSTYKILFILSLYHFYE